MMKLQTEPTNPMAREGHEFMAGCKLPTLVEGQFDRFDNPISVQPVRQKRKNPRFITANTGT